nr:hypothetical protein [Luteimicrobium album]
MELAARYAPSCVGEHVRGAVDPDNPMAPGREVLREPAGSARRVQRDPAFPVLQERGDDGLVQGEQPAASPRVVAGGRLLIGGRGVDRFDEDPAVAQLRVVEQSPDLRDPGLDERTVMVSGPRVQEGGAFEAEQVRQRVLVDHEQQR